MTRWKLTVEYDGRAFSGWQRQDHAPSVQQTIEEAITKFCQQEIRVHAAGRTDAGVHAWGQVAHFDLDYGDRPLTGYELAKALNAHIRLTPASVVAAEQVDDEFHARFSALNKLYTYRIVCRSSKIALDEGRAWHYKKPLDVDAMREGAKYLIGHHDFTTFRATECQAKTPMRTLHRLDIEAQPYDSHGGVELRIHAEGRSFLHHQVRNMVGTLTLVGEGKWKPEDIKTALEAKDRTKGGVTCPPDGLYLVRIDY
jgi:tRNA pseudouridine38-40 synthase